MKIFAVVDPFVIENSNSIKFLELTLNEVGFDTSDIEYIPSFPEELKTAPLPDTQIFLQFQKDLQDYVDEAQPDLILAFGNNSICTLGLVSKAAGIMKTRGKLLDYRGIKTVASISPNLVLKEPVYESDFQEDIALAFNGADIIEFQIVDIYTPEDVYTLIEEAQETGQCAYDWETTDKDPSKITTIPVTCAFATGKQVDGKYLVYFVQFYDKLKPCFTEEEETALIDAFDVFFTQAGKEFDLIGHNIGFDDWVTEEWLQHKIYGSTYDTMIEKWSYNNIRPHGLKETVAKYLGIPEYDKVMDENVKEIKARRGKILTHPDDFLSLEFAGISPVATTKTTKKNGTVTTYKWPDKTVLDKGFCAYAMLERDILREYNAKDALYTLHLHNFFKPRILEEDLQVSCDFRHRLTKQIIRAEQRGLPLNVEVNRAYDKELEALDKQTLFQLKEMVGCVPGCEELTEEFNPNSSEQVAKVIFGATAKVPLIARKPLYREFKKESVDRIVDKVEALVYGDYSDVKDMIRSEEFDYELAKEFLDEEYRKQSKDWNSQLQYEDKLLGLGGLGYDPVSVSKKTQQPGTGKVSLLLLQNQKQTDFLNLVLMYRKVTKLRSTFIQKLFKTVDRFGISRTHYNTTGTDSARISSSGNYNAQNFPKYIRGQLHARPGYYLLSCDLKAVEVRVLAAYCKDEGLLKAIYAEDTHKTVASIIFNVPFENVTDDQRGAGKIVVFLTLYGGGAEKLAKFLNKSVSEAQDIINKFLARFPDIKNFIESQHKSAKEPPYCVYTAWGTRRSVKNILSNDREVAAKFERISVNSPVQGSAGELGLWYACEFMDMCEREGWFSYIGEDNLVNFVATVHDEITFEIHESLISFTEEEYEEKGKIKIKQHISGPAWDVFNEAVSQTVPYPPLDEVLFEFDAAITKCWAGEPDLHKALESSKNPEEKFIWELLKGNTGQYKDEEAKEFEDEFSEFVEPEVE